MERELKEYEVYLFDMDGTLVNSEPLKGRALARACLDYGVQVDNNIYKDVMGESWQVVTGHFFAHANILPDLTEFNGYFRSHYEKMLNNELELNVGAKVYIDQLKNAGKKCGVVSSAATWMVENILSSLQLENAFDLVITQEHVTKHKPDPEAYTLALTKLNVSPEQTIVFEDSTAGIRAGKSSGCDVIAVKHDFNGKNDLSDAIKAISTYEEMFV
ncbi:HAD family hydrolase [Salinivibrio proteolyticus]|uniref:HAD family phosphatase n=1 Tax=Salinivibrio proteolyticus TaxID=334715 RepID=A0ABY7LCA5_9GAMM|nr:HAD family phosphatase [Salinivibrio proteolyticus]WBA13786.1 HAD family phosphatase [Salinivibrio proteolyticus]